MSFDGNKNLKFVGDPTTSSRMFITASITLILSGCGPLLYFASVVKHQTRMGRRIFSKRRRRKKI